MVVVFPSLVRECVILPPPFPLSLWTLRRLPSVRLSVSGPPFRLGVSAPNRLPPVGLRSILPPWPVRLFQALPAFLRFVFLSLSPPGPPPTLLFSLSLDSPFCSVDPPHTFSLCLSGTPRQITSICLTLLFPIPPPFFFYFRPLPLFCLSQRMLSLPASTSVFCFGSSIQPKFFAASLTDSCLSVISLQNSQGLLPHLVQTLASL